MVQSACDLSPVQKPRGRSGTPVCRLLRGSLAPEGSLFHSAAVAPLWFRPGCTGFGFTCLHGSMRENAAHGPKARRCEAATVLLKGLVAATPMASATHAACPVVQLDQRKALTGGFVQDSCF